MPRSGALIVLQLKRLRVQRKPLAQVKRKGANRMQPHTYRYGKLSAADCMGPELRGADSMDGRARAEP
jgi:hypothetical protein